MKQVALKHVCSVISRGSAPTYSDEDDGTALAVGQSCQTQAGIFDLTRSRWHVGPVPVKGRLRNGDVLLNSTGTGTLGRVALVDHLPVSVPCFADGHVTLLRAREDAADPRFIAYVLGLPANRRFVEDCLSFGATKQRELSVEALRAHALEIPRLERQTEVANFLDRECARVADLREQYEALPGVVLERQRVDLEGALLEHRRNYPLKKLCWETSFLNGFAFQSEAFVHEPAEGVKLLRGINLTSTGTRWEDVVYWPTDRLVEVQRFKLQPGDLVVGLNRPWIRGGLRCAIIEPDDLPALLLQRVGCLRPRPGSSLRLEYAKLWLHTQHFRQTVRDDAAVTFPMLEPPRLLRYRLPVPNADLQAKLIGVDFAHRRLRQRLVERIHAMSDGLVRYRDSLITEAVVGALDVTRLGDRQMDESLDAVRHGERPEILAG